MSIFERLWTNYWELSDYLKAGGDPRASQYFLMHSWWPTFLICSIYVFTMTYGQCWMKHRQAWNLRGAMIAYNVLMVLLNAYLTYEILAAGWWSDYGIGCASVDPSWEGRPARLVQLGHLFFLTKFVEMLDTLFFLLRKKFHLISFLHVFHHATLPASIWFGLKLAPGGSGGFFPLTNSFIHVVMYTYYGIAAAGPKYAKYLWWKPFLTIAQMTQFILYIGHNQQFIHKPCLSYSFLFSMAIYVYAWIFLILFANYFIHEHFGSKSRQAKIPTSTSNNCACQEKTSVSNQQEDNEMMNGNVDTDCLLGKKRV